MLARVKPDDAFTGMIDGMRIDTQFTRRSLAP
jgi:hypothetical protein